MSYGIRNCFIHFSNVVAVACENQTLSIYSTATGATIASGIVTGSSISTLCSCSSYVMVVTATGQIVVWYVHYRIIFEAHLYSILSACKHVFFVGTVQRNHQIRSYLMCLCLSCLLVRTSVYEDSTIM